MSTRKTVYNNLVSEDVWERVNEENKELMEEYLTYLSSVGRSKETIKQYTNNLKIFFCWYVKGGKNKFFVDVTKRELMKYQGFLSNVCGMGSKRVRSLKSVLSSLSNYIESFLEDDFPKFRNIINKIESPADNPVREKTVLEFEDVNPLVDKLVANHKIQLACLVMVACYSGLRLQELTRLLVKDFTTDIKLILDDNFYKTSSIRVKGRGNKKAEKYIWRKCDKWLHMWLDEREKEGIDCEYLFCRKINGKYVQLLPSSMDSFARTVSNYLGKSFYWHSLRHFFGTQLSKKGLPIEIIQSLLGHASSDTTNLYIDISEEDKLSKFSDVFSGKVDKIQGKGLSDLNE